MPPKNPDINVIGAGIIGLSIAWQAQRNGHQVLLIDKGIPGEGASWVAAGMLAPASEIEPGKEEEFQRRQRSLELYPGFLEELRRDAGHAPRIHRVGSLWIEREEHDPSVLEHKRNLWQELGVPMREVSPKEAAEQSGSDPTKVRSAWELPDEAEINNRTLLKDLLQAFLNQGGELVENTEVQGIEGERGAWRVRSSKGNFQSEELILSAGVESKNLEGKEGSSSSLFPMKGVILELEGGTRPAPILRSPGCYLVAKGPKTLLLGGSMEERDDRTVHAETVRELLREAHRIFPAIDRLAWHRANVGHRPTLPEHEPRVERDPDSGLIRAIGHFRHGVLNAPWTAYRVLDILDG